MRCSIPSCKSQQHSTFGVPKSDELLNKWIQSLRVKLKPNSRICEIHFKPEDVIKTWTSGQGFNKYTICLKRARLRDGAVPIRCNSVPNKGRDNSITMPMLSNPQNKIKIQENTSTRNILMEHCYSIVNEDNIGTSVTADHLDTSDASIENLTISLTSEHSTQLIENKKPVDVGLFHSVMRKLNFLTIPQNWISDITFQSNKSNKIIAFYKMGSFGSGYFRCVEKQIVFRKDSSIIIHVFDKEILTQDIGLPVGYEPKTIEDLENIIGILESTKICKGAISSNKYPDIKSEMGHKLIESCGQWRHVKCTRILNKNNESELCLWCKRLWYCVKNKVCKLNKRKCFSSNNKIILETLRSTNAVIKKQNARYVKRNNQLKNKLKELQNKLKEITDSSLQTVLENHNIPTTQTDLIFEIVNASKIKNLKNRKYSENWMSLCSMFHARSPSGYSFLRDQNILPLPCISTIKNHL